MEENARGNSRHTRQGRRLHLLSPFAIGRVALRNRVVFQPISCCSAISTASDDHVAYHAEQGAGAVSA